MRITFAAAVNNREILESNLLASPCLLAPHRHQILLQDGFSSAAKAYNDAIERSLNDLIVFCHQDVFFPESWLGQLNRALDYLEMNDLRWGVLGCYGKSADGRGWGHLYSSGCGVLGGPLEHPAPIQTLDEVVLIIRKSLGLRFDDRLPHFHLYGADICLAAATMGMKSYAISAFCIHNTQQAQVLSREFYECCTHLKQAWGHHLPIQSTCVKITRFNIPLYKTRLKEVYLRCTRGNEVAAFRVKNVQRLLEDLAASRRI
jgi:hypothetical protein